MGTVTLTIEVLGADGSAGRSEPVEVIADTEATLTVLPRELLARLGIEPARNPDGTPERVRVLFANGQKALREVGEARLRVDGKAVTTRVMFGEAGDARLLGVIVLESLGLAVDPVDKRLVPTDYLLL